MKSDVIQVMSLLLPVQNNDNSNSQEVDTKQSDENPGHREASFSGYTCQKVLDLGGVCGHLAVRTADDASNDDWDQKSFHRRRVCLDLWEPWNQCGSVVSIASYPQSSGDKAFRHSIELLGCGNSLNTLAIDPERVCMDQGSNGGSENLKNSGSNQETIGFSLSAAIADLQLSSSESFQVLDVNAPGCEHYLLAELIAQPGTSHQDGRNRKNSDKIDSGFIIDKHRKHNMNETNINSNRPLIKPKHITIKYTFVVYEENSEMTVVEQQEPMIFSGSRLPRTISLVKGLTEAGYMLMHAAAGENCVDQVQAQLDLCLPTFIDTTWILTSI